MQEVNCNVNNRYFIRMDGFQKLIWTCLINGLCHFLLNDNLQLTWSRSLVSSVCSCCGGARFIPCLSCSGSRKSVIHHFVTDSIALRCVNCNSAGLIKCPKCSGDGTHRRPNSHWFQLKTRTSQLDVCMRHLNGHRSDRHLRRINYIINCSLYCPWKHSYIEQWGELCQFLKSNDQI